MQYLVNLAQHAEAQKHVKHRVKLAAGACLWGRAGAWQGQSCKAQPCSPRGQPSVAQTAPHPTQHSPKATTPTHHALTDPQCTATAKSISNQVPVSSCDQPHIWMIQHCSAYLVQASSTIVRLRVWLDKAFMLQTTCLWQPTSILVGPDVIDTKASAPSMTCRMARSCMPVRE